MTHYVRIMAARLARPFLLAAAFAAVVSSSSAADQTGAISVRALSAITAPAPSAVMPDIGQNMHVVTVLFPTATDAVTDSLQVRIEASFDGSIWIPISPDITAARRIGGVTYAMIQGYGPWPKVRVRAVQVPGASLPMTVYYWASVAPVVSYIEEEQDRFIL